jgi:hypothetical protein
VRLEIVIGSVAAEPKPAVRLVYAQAARFTPGAYTGENSGGTLRFGKT